MSFCFLHYHTAPPPPPQAQISEICCSILGFPVAPDFSAFTSLTDAGSPIWKDGVTLMLWIGVQFYVFPPNFMSTIYFVFGAAQAATGYAAWVFRKQESFHVDIADYPNIGTNPKRLVVFSSRMGYARKLAYEEASRTGATVYEVKSTERTEGTLGFWWCGRYGMCRWAMPIEPVRVDLTAYDHVTIVSAIWVFALSAMMRSFCLQAAGKVREADYILVHHTRGLYANAAREMDALLGVRHTRLRSVECKMGDFVATREE